MKNNFLNLQYFPQCALTQDYLTDCSTGAGGLALQIWLIELNNISSLGESSGTITAITKVATKIFRKYQLVRETASEEETITGNIQAGTVFYAQKLAIVINKQSVAVRNEILLLAVNNLVAIVQDNNGTYRLLGRTLGLRLNDGTAGSGTALADRNGYTLNFTGTEPQLAPFVADAVILTLQT